MSLFRRVTIIVAFIAVVVVALVLRNPGEADPDDGSSTPAPSPSATVPTEVPIEQFCAAFEAMAAAHANHLANDTPASLAEVEAAGQLVLDLAPGTAMPPLAHGALTYLVDGVIGVDGEPVSEEADAALATFLQAACPPGL